MSTRSSAIPATTNTAIVLVGLAGALVLSIHETLAPLGAVVGLWLAMVLAGARGSYWRVGLATSLFVASIIGSLGLVGNYLSRAGSSVPLLALAAVAIGFTVGLLAADRTSQDPVEHVGAIGLYSAFIAMLWVLALGAISGAGGLGPLLSGLLWLGGPGAVGFAVSIALAACGVVAAAYAVPPVVVTRPGRLDSYRNRRTGLVNLLIALLFFVSVLLFVSQYVPIFGDLVDILAGLAVVRGLLAVVFVVGLVVALIGSVARHEWSQTTAARSDVVPVLSGALLGVSAFVTVAYGSGVSPSSLAGLLIVSAVVLVALAIVIGDVERDVLTKRSLLGLVLALGYGGIATGMEAELGYGPGAILEAAAVFFLFAAGAFVSDVGRYGRLLGSEIGDGARSLPQFIRLGWSGTVSLLGFVVAVVGFVGAVVLAPVLSASATVTVLLGLGAVVVGVWLLLS